MPTASQTCFHSRPHLPHPPSQLGLPVDPPVPLIRAAAAVVACTAGGADLNTVLLSEDGAVERLDGDLACPQLRGRDHTVTGEKRLVRARRAEPRRGRAETEETRVRGGGRGRRDAACQRWGEVIRSRDGRESAYITGQSSWFGRGGGGNAGSEETVQRL